MRFVQGDQGDAGVLVLVREHARQEGRAEAGGYQVDDKVDLAAARCHTRLHAFALARGEDFGVEGEAGFEQDKWRICQVGEVDSFALGQGVADRQDGHQRFVTHGLVVETFVYGQQEGRQVDLTCFQAFTQSFTAVLGQFDVDIGVACAIGGKHRRKQHATAHRRQADAQYTAFETTQVIDLSDQIVVFGQQNQGAAVGDFASGGEFIAMAKAVEQWHAQFVLQGFDRLAHTRLGQGHHFSGLRETALANHFDKGTQCSQVHQYSFFD